jgi:hypothetical protein
MMGITRRRLVAFTLALLLAAPGMAWADLSAGAAFQQGQAAAAGGAAATGSVNATGAAGNVPGYTDAPKEAQQWGGGTVSLSGPGLGKQAGCLTSDTAGYGGKECDAINFLGGSRPQYPLQSNDALFNLSHGITSANRDSIAGMTGGNGTGGCTTLEVTDPDLQSTEHCQEWLEPTDNQCTVGRVVTVDRDANYQCGKTVSSLETFTCSRRASVLVTPAISGTTGRLVVATIRSGAYLFKNGDQAGLWVHGLNGVEAPVATSANFAGDSLGLSSSIDYGGSKRLLASHNGCGDNCSGSFSYQVLRGNGTWWDIVSGTFSQEPKNALVCPKSFYVSEAWYGSSGYLSATASCPDGLGRVSVSASRQAGWCGSTGTRSATLAPGQSLDMGGSYSVYATDWETGQRYLAYTMSCPASITYNGSGSFSYNYWSHHDASSDASSWKSTGFTIPTQKDEITIAEVNECAILESRSR